MNFIEKYKLLTIYVMSFMYVFIGIKHFTNPQYFLDIVPPQLPSKLFLVYFTGMIEVVGGAAILTPKTRNVGAYLLIFLLLSVFPANIYLYVSETPQSLLGISKTDALIRMPFQIPLILLAFWHSKKNHPKWVAYLSSLVFPPTIIYFLSI
ncbi:MAG: DoxX family protein [Flavobacteriaceae bacterium]|nr:DoxX family protein [Flavobacteriaceae bacterium]|tara:strand:- start:5079 stop:5531 length:453 start_codon:yes stop_codon:yes gene_type:complete